MTEPRLHVAAEPLYRLFDATVRSVQRLSPTFVRVTLGGRGLDDFAWDGLDQRVKVLFPNADGGYPAMQAKDPDWYRQWSALPDAVRPTMRTYTIRDRRQGFRGVEVDLDFALHEASAGPAARWAARAGTGMPLRMLGPNALAAGVRGAIGWIPPVGAKHFVIAGDETAVPAMAGILSSLPHQAHVTLFAELPSRDDLVVLAPARAPGLPETPAPSVRGLLPGIDGRFVPRGTEPGQALADAVCAEFPARPEAAGADPDDVDIEHETLWEVPGIDPITGGRRADDRRRASTYVWLAGEAAAIKRIRRHLVRDVGFDRQAVSFMGYWRRGRSEY